MSAPSYPDTMSADAATLAPLQKKREGMWRWLSWLSCMLPVLFLGQVIARRSLWAGVMLMLSVAIVGMVYEWIKRRRNTHRGAEAVSSG